MVPEEYHTLTIVPAIMHGMPGQIRCEVQPGHGAAIHLLETPDHRTIELCGECFTQIQKDNRKRNEL